MKTAIVALAAALALTSCAKEVALVKGEPPAVTGSLEGGPWLVEDINGGGVIDNARVDITFDPGDQDTSAVYGKSACNRFKGGWKQDGAGLVLGPLASTMMMCPPALMDTEQKFLKTLEAVRSVTFDATGAALLKAPDGRIIKIRREAK
ncbi:MAG: META domain-containing protein [Polymorphobacter sp.]